MPYKHQIACKHPGCPELTDKSYCDKHKGLHKRSTSKQYNSRWKKIRKKFLMINPICKSCYNKNKITPAVDVHHIITLRDGGTNDFDNLMPLCHSCHSKITRKYIPEYKY